VIIRPASSLAQDRESSPFKDKRSTTVLRLQLKSDVAFVGHIAVYPPASLDFVGLAWNYEDILQTLHKHRCVLAYLAGHTHNSAYSQDENGKHHVGFPGVIEAPPNCPAAHATILLYPNCVVIKAAEGSGMSDIQMDIKNT